jgi:hypothetical protein
VETLQAESTSGKKNVRTETKSDTANDSPDLFSQDESDQSFKEFASQMNELMDAAERGELHNAKSNEQNPVPKASEQTSRLFEEMQKFDEENGKLNLSVSTSPSKHNRSVISGRAGDAMDGEEKIQLDVSPEVKKKMSKKITDYFSKKTI